MRQLAEYDEQAVLAMLLPRAQARIDGQLRGSDALDTKAFGLLGLDAAAIALMVAVRDDVHTWWVPTAALGLAGALLLSAVWPRALDLGPDTRRLYETMGASSPLVVARQMLAELLAAGDENNRRLSRKSRLFRAGFALLIAALIGALAVSLL